MDLIQTLLAAAELEHTRVRNYIVTGDRIANWNEIREIVTTVLLKRNIPLRLKPRLVKSIAGFIETSASLFGIYPVINRDKANELILEWTCSDEKARRELGYRPEYSLEEGLSRDRKSTRLNSSHVASSSA